MPLYVRPELLPRKTAAVGHFQAEDKNGWQNFWEVMAGSRDKITRWAKALNYNDSDNFYQELRHFLFPLTLAHAQALGGHAADASLPFDSAAQDEEHRLSLAAWREQERQKASALNKRAYNIERSILRASFGPGEDVRHSLHPEHTLKVIGTMDNGHILTERESGALCLVGDVWNLEAA